MFFVRLRWVLLLSAALVFLLVPLTPDAMAEEGFRLRVLSLNVKALPWPIRTEVRGLMRQVGKDLAARRKAGNAPDIVLIQEGFSRYVRKLLKEAGYAHVIKGPGKSLTRAHLASPGRGEFPGTPARERRTAKSGKATNSGLYILSRYPIIAQTEEIYGKYCSGNDCLANKGILHVRVKLPGTLGGLDIFNTHMDADIRSEAKKRARAKAHRRQSDILRRFVTRTRKGRAAILAGDFNIRDRERAQYFHRHFKLQDAGKLCEQNREKCTISGQSTRNNLWQNSNDHHFILPGRGFDIRPVHAERRSAGKVSGRNITDHLTFEVVYELSPN